MTVTEQFVTLFASVAGVLVIASIVGFILKRRHAAGGPNAVIDNLNSRIKAWWVIVITIGIAFMFGKSGIIALFCFASFASLREFINLTQTHDANDRALVIASFLVVPTQY